MSLNDACFGSRLGKDAACASTVHTGIRGPRQWPRAHIRSFAPGTEQLEFVDCVNDARFDSPKKSRRADRQ